MTLEDDEALARRTARATFVTRVFVVLAVALLVAVLAVLVNLSADSNNVLTTVRAAQVSNKPVLTTIQRAAKAAEAGTARIEDCTTPGRTCFDRGTDQTADAIASINKVSIIAAACADKPRRQTVEQIQACVIAELARQSGDRK